MKRQKSSPQVARKAKMNDKERVYQLTPKVIALAVAIESGLLTEVEGGWDDSKFNVFWEKYEANLQNYGYIVLKKDSAKN